MLMIVVRDETYFIVVMVGIKSWLFVVACGALSWPVLMTSVFGRHSPCSACGRCGTCAKPPHLMQIASRDLDTRVINIPRGGAVFGMAMGDDARSSLSYVRSRRWRTIGN